MGRLNINSEKQPKDKRIANFKEEGQIDGTFGQQIGSEANQLHAAKTGQEDMFAQEQVVSEKNVIHKPDEDIDKNEEEE